MSNEKDDKLKATRRLNTDEVNKKSHSKRTSKASNGETQIVGKVNNTSNGKNKKSKPKKKKFKEKHPRIATIIKIFIILIVLLLIILAGIFAGAMWGGYNFFDLLGDDYKIDIEDLVIGYENSIVYDTAGNQIATLSSGAKRKSVSLDQMSPYLPKAYLAIEDERFYKHSGVDFKRTAAATVTYILHGGSSSFGGSTITQQVVKNITGDKKDNAMRKMKEMAKALQVEHYLSKDQILELYLNLIFVGGEDVNGVALGAIYYFDKDVKDLSIAECAYMAAINHSPNAYNPFKEDEKKEKRIENGHKRAKTVLKKMKELGSINSEEYDKAIADIDAGLAFKNGNTSATTLVSYQTEAALDQIVDQMVEEKGLSRDLAEMKLYSGGYHIYTTQDTPIQGRLEQELENEKYLITSANGQKSMASMTIVDPKTGAVIAASAGIGADKTHTYLGYFNYTTDMKKQTGSSIKPLSVIAPGLENGTIVASTSFYDGPTNFPGKYAPGNETGFTNMNMTLRTAVAKSQNIPHVKALSNIGVKESVQFCQSIGLKEITGKEGLSLALGGLDTGVSTMQMASAYATIANDGVYIEPIFYTKVLDKEGNTYIEPKSVEDRSTRVMSAGNAYIVKNLMRGVVEGPGGTGTYCAIPGIAVAAKTGTTNSRCDRWLCGFTNYYVGACWFGFNENERVNWRGTNPAGLIWSNVMKDIHSGKESSNFVKPSNIVSATVCIDSGMAASDKCTNIYVEEFVEGTVPAVCDKHELVKVCNDTGLLASEWCQNYTEKYFPVLSNQETAGNWTTDYGTTYVRPTEICPHTIDDYNYED